jgi:hypothetical protein
MLRQTIFTSLVIASGTLIALPANAFFTVTQFNSTEIISSLADADSLINGNNVLSSTSQEVDFIDFSDDGSSGLFSGSSPWLNAPADVSAHEPINNNFAALITALIEIPEAGIWTFGTRSDGGLRFIVNDVLVLNDDSLHPARNLFGAIELDAGVHSLELVFFEKDAGAELELFAAKGNYKQLNADFRLIGDTEKGGLATAMALPPDDSPVKETTPEPSLLLGSLMGLVAGMTTLTRKNEAKRKIN